MSVCTAVWSSAPHIIHLVFARHTYTVIPRVVIISKVIQTIIILIQVQKMLSTISSCISCLTRTYRFNPCGITSHCRQILMPSRCNQHDIFDSDAPHALVPFQHFMVNMLRISHRTQQVRRKVYARLDRLQFQVVSDRR